MYDPESEAQLIAEIERHGAGHFPDSLAARVHADAAQRKVGLGEILAQRFSPLPGLRLPDLRRAGRRAAGIGSGAAPAGSPGFGCPATFTKLAGRTSDEGFIWATTETPSIGPVLTSWPPHWAGPARTYHRWSAQTRRDTGEVSLAAACIPSAWPAEYSPFFGAQGVHVSAGISQLVFLPELPRQAGIGRISASARTIADHVREVVGLWSFDSRRPYAVFAYGFVNIRLSSGLNLFGGPPGSSVWNWHEFLTQDQIGPATARDLSDLDGGGHADVTAIMPYDGSTLFQVDVSYDIIVGTEYGASTAGEVGAVVDLRFGDDDNLVVVEDGVFASNGGQSCPLQLAEINLCGAPSLRPHPRH